MRGACAGALAERSYYSRLLGRPLEQPEARFESNPWEGERSQMQVGREGRQGCR